jgi:hypothetical protein
LARLVQLVNQDALDVLDERGGYDLIFADAQDGKWTGLDRTIAALSPGGLLVVDDMAPQAWWNSEHTRRQELVRQTLLSHPALLTVELVRAAAFCLAPGSADGAGPGHSGSRRHTWLGSCVASAGTGRSRWPGGCESIPAICCRDAWRLP